MGQGGPSRGWRPSAGSSPRRLKRVLRRSPRYPPPVTRGGVARTSIAPAKPALETSTTGRERFSIGPLLVDGRAPVGPRTGALERRGGAQDARIVEATPDDLQSDRQPLVGEPAWHRRSGLRSEEHTSELQSQSNLVCRLLLEKKKRQGI